MKELREYKKIHGTVHISRRIDEPLNKWLHYIKRKDRKGYLPQHHKVQLNDFRIYLESLESKCSFEEKMSNLLEYKKKYGTANVSSSIDARLHRFIYEEIVKYKKGKLSKKRTLALKREGVDMDNSNILQRKRVSLEERLKELKQFKKQHGNTDVSYSDNRNLQRWLDSQKSKYREGRLSKENALTLTKVGVDLNKIKHFKIHSTFEERINQIKAYKKLHNTAKVSTFADNGL